jgi:6-pyruvoyl-tetrahydropterin synthase
MFSVCVRDHFMIAHSFSGEAFGPAQRLHGATYVVDVELKKAELDANGIVADIGLAATTLKKVLDELNYRNLDELEQFAGKNTTTEYLARTIFERLRKEIARGALGPEARALHSMRVVLHESHIAWAAYENDLDGAH